jgi:X-X-X-Leu-X-X-Gly heptad repeat protein
MREATREYLPAPPTKRRKLAFAGTQGDCVDDLSGDAGDLSSGAGDLYGGAGDLYGGAGDLLGGDLSGGAVDSQTTILPTIYRPHHEHTCKTNMEINILCNF